MHFLSNEVEDKWIEDYVEIETLGQESELKRRGRGSTRAG